MVVFHIHLFWNWGLIYNDETPWCVVGVFAHFMADFCIHVCVCTPQLITLKEAWNLTPPVFTGLSHRGKGPWSAHLWCAHRCLLTFRCMTSFIAWISNHGKVCCESNLWIHITVVAVIMSKRVSWRKCEHKGQINPFPQHHCMHANLFTFAYFNWFSCLIWLWLTWYWLMMPTSWHDAPWLDLPSTIPFCILYFFFFFLKKQQQKKHPTQINLMKYGLSLFIKHWTGLLVFFFHKRRCKRVLFGQSSSQSQGHQFLAAWFGL